MIGAECAVGDALPRRQARGACHAARFDALCVRHLTTEDQATPIMSSPGGQVARGDALTITADDQAWSPSAPARDPRQCPEDRENGAADVKRRTNGRQAASVVQVLRAKDDSYTHGLRLRSGPGPMWRSGAPAGRDIARPDGPTGRMAASGRIGRGSPIAVARA